MKYRRTSKKPGGIGGWFLLLLAWGANGDVLRTARVTVKEGTQRDELILDLIAGIWDTSAGQRLFPSDGVERSFVQSTTSKIFEVDQVGQVRLKQDLDREGLCGKEAECVFTSIVSVLPQEVYQKVAVEVTVKDENDNAPRFNATDGLITIEIDENAPVGKRIEMNQIRATDADPGLFGDIKYELSEGAKFSIIDEDFRTYLIPQEELDRETEPQWVGSVTATDGGGRKAQTRLKVLIRDENDNAPRFTGTRFVATVSEDKQPGTFVYQVEAVDADKGRNAEVTYQLLGSEPDKASGLFEIDSKSGYITTKAKIDREEFDKVILTIGAADNGEQSLMAKCQVTVTVIDENDHAPEISVTHVTTEGDRAVVMENQKSGTFVSFVTVTDGDLGQNGKFVAAVKPKDKFQLIADNIEGSLILVTRAPFDREKTQSQNVTITACDQGTPKKCSSIQFNLAVGDENDNAPLFTDEVTRLSIVENISIGTAIATVTATDLDAPEKFGLIGYSLSGLGSADFNIDPESGQITVSQTIDYESQRSYNLTVIAQDGGGLSATALVVIEVGNLNDNAPGIAVADVVYLDKDAVPGDLVMDLKPFDHDGPVPIVTMAGPDAHRFVLDGNLLYLADNFAADKDSLIQIEVRDAEDLASVSTYELQILAPRSHALLGAAIGCSIVLVIVVGVVAAMRLCNYEKYKLGSHFGSLRRGAGGAEGRGGGGGGAGGGDIGAISQKTLASDDNYSRSDYIITSSVKMGASNTDCSLGGGKHKMDSDSGRGESESETHSRRINNNSLVHLGDWCRDECLTLGHSDQCWLPQIVPTQTQVVTTSSQSAYEVDVSPNVNCLSSLSVWDKTSDYSSHSNRSSEKPLTRLHTSKPCFV